MLKKLMLAVAGMVALPAMAATDVWNFNSGSIQGTGNGNTFNVNGSGTNKLSMKGYSDTGGTSDNLLETGRLSYSSSYGLMLQNRDENNTVPSHSNTVPSHSIDSYGNDVDMVLLTFDTAVSLTRFGIGWACEFPNSQQSSCESNIPSANAQADITVAAYTGSGAFTMSSSATWSSLVSNNWSTVGHYGNVSDWSYQSVSTTITSKYWLIGAYNPAFGGASGTVD